MKLMPIILNINHIEHDSLGSRMKSVENGQGVDRQNFSGFADPQGPGPVFGPVQGCIQPVSEMVAISESIGVRMMWK